MNTHFRRGFFALAIVAFAFVTGCSSGGMFDTTSSSGDPGGPTVPFSFNMGSTTNLGVPAHATGKFDATAPQNGGFTWTLNTPTETAQSTGLIMCGSGHTAAGRCYTTSSTAVGGTAGYNIEIAYTYTNSTAGFTPSPSSVESINGTCAAGNFCVVCTGNVDAHFGASCVGKVPSSSLTNGDAAVFMANTREHFTSDAGLGVSALYVEVYRNDDDFNVANGTVNFAPDTTDGGGSGPNSSDNLVEDDTIAHDLSLVDDLTLSALGARAVAAQGYDITNTADPMTVFVSTDFAVSMSTNMPKSVTAASGSVANATYQNLNFLAKICTSIGNCTDPRGDLPTDFNSLGIANTGLASSMSLASFQGSGNIVVSSPFASMVQEPTQNAIIEAVDFKSSNWTADTSFNDYLTATYGAGFTAKEVAVIAKLKGGFSYFEGAFYTYDGKAAVAQASSDTQGLWSAVGSEFVAAATINDISIGDGGNFGYVAYMDDGKPYMKFYDPSNPDQQDWQDGGLNAFVTAMGATAVTSVSAMRVGNFSQGLQSAVFIAVAWKDDGGTNKVTMIEGTPQKNPNSNTIIGITWSKFANDITATASRMDLAVLSFPNDRTVHLAFAMSYVDSSSPPDILKYAFLDAQDLNAPGNWTGFTIDNVGPVDTIAGDQNRTSIAWGLDTNDFTSNALYAVGMNTVTGALQVYKVTGGANGGVTVTQFGSDLDGRATAGAYVDASNQGIAVLYLDEAVEHVLVKLYPFLFVKTPVDNGGGQKP